jgi:hypothetical protein
MEAAEIIAALPSARPEGDVWSPRCPLAEYNRTGG